MTLLRRNLHCLEDLQAKLEGHIDPKLVSQCRQGFCPETKVERQSVPLVRAPSERTTRVCGAFVV